MCDYTKTLVHITLEYWDLPFYGIALITCGLVIYCLSFYNLNSSTLIASVASWTYFRVLTEFKFNWLVVPVGCNCLLLLCILWLLICHFVSASCFRMQSLWNGLSALAKKEIGCLLFFFLSWLSFLHFKKKITLLIF